MSYTTSIQDLAKLCKEAYKETNKRQRIFNILGKDHYYDEDRSNGLYCFYENAEVILIGIHGADDFRLSLLAVEQFISPARNAPEIDKFCKLHTELLQDTRPKIVAAHSLGGWVISECESKLLNNHYEGVLFAPYTPTKSGSIVDFMSQTSKFKKIFYDNDFFANNLLEVRELNNAFILTPSTMPLTFINGHALANFSDSNLVLLNMDISKIIPAIERADEKKKEEQQIENSTTITIMSYNIFLFEDLVQDVKSDKRANWIADEIIEKHGDVEIIVFQEMFSESATDILVRRLNKAGYNNTKKVSGGNVIKQAISSGFKKFEDGGVMVFSKLQFNEQKQVVFNEGTKDDKIAAKGGVRMRVMKDGIPINIIGTHLQSGRKEIHFDIKTSQIEQLQGLAKKDEINFIVGDLNYDFNNFQSQLKQFLDEQNLDMIDISGGSTTNVDLTEEDEGSWLDYILYQKTEDYQISGLVNVVKIRHEEGFRIDKNPIGLLKDPKKFVNQEVKKVGRKIKGIFKSKKKRRRQKRKRRENRTNLVFNLSNHYAIKSTITINSLN